MNEGSIGSMKKLGITESYKLKRQVVLSASEAAEMIIRSVNLNSLQYTYSLCFPELTIFCVRHRGNVKQYKKTCSITA